MQAMSPISDGDPRHRAALLVTSYARCCRHFRKRSSGEASESASAQWASSAKDNNAMTVSEVCFTRSSSGATVRCRPSMVCVCTPRPRCRARETAIHVVTAPARGWARWQMASRPACEPSRRPPDCERVAWCVRVPPPLRTMQPPAGLL